MAVLVAGCAGATLSDEELRAPSRNVQITVQNETRLNRAIWFSGTTLEAREMAAACRAVTVRYEPEPETRPMPGMEESWSLVIGEASVDGGGDLIGIKGPFTTIARSIDPPLDRTTAAILVVVEEDTIRWRVLEPDEAEAPPEGRLC